MSVSRNDSHYPIALTAAGIALSILIGSQFVGQQEESNFRASSNGVVSQTDYQIAPSDADKIHTSAGLVNWNKVAKDVKDSVVSITVSTASGAAAGSGVILDANGTIVTNAHVILAGAQNGRIEVALSDNSVYRATVVKTDDKSDLAILKLNSVPKNLKPITIGDSSKMQVGDPVLAIGNPLGLSGTVTNGIVSSLNRPVTTQPQAAGSQQDQNSPDSSTKATDLATVISAIQTNAAINEGNSGGALLNAQGQLIGINSSIATADGSKGNIGIGFAIPSQTMLNVTKFLAAGKDFPYGRLGLAVVSSAASVDKESVLGAKVQDVLSGSGAQAAGLQKDDVVVGLNGQSVSSSNELVALVRTMEAGQTVKLDVYRGGVKRQFDVTLIK